MHKLDIACAAIFKLRIRCRTAKNCSCQALFVLMGSLSTTDILVNILYQIVVIRYQKLHHRRTRSRCKVHIELNHIIFFHRRICIQFISILIQYLKVDRRLCIICIHGHYRKHVQQQRKRQQHPEHSVYQPPTHTTHNFILLFYFFLCKSKYARIKKVSRTSAMPAKATLYNIALLFSDTCTLLFCSIFS